MLHHRPGSADGQRYRGSSLERGNQGPRRTHEESSYLDETNSQGYQDYNHRYRGSRIDRDIQGRSPQSNWYVSPGTNSGQGRGRGSRQVETGTSARWHGQSIMNNRPDRTRENSYRESRPRRPQDVENIPVAVSSGAYAGASSLLGPTEGPSLEQLYRKAVLTSSEDEDCPYMVGTCPDMCPGPEREKRARLRDLAVFERLDNDQGRTSKELAVKKFCRTFSRKDLKQSDIRPLSVLCQTMEHLLKTMDKHEYSFELIHDFLFDRTRAVRQELSMQRISGKQAVCIMENIVRFHIISERELRQRRVSGRTFDSHLNLQQLMKSLVSLLNLYIMTSKDDDQLGNEAEFSCYYALLNLNQTQQLALWFKGIRHAVWNAPDMKFARSILRCYRQENYTGFFRLARDGTYLQSCLLELYFNEVRANAIRAINHGAYKLHPYPVVDLANLLLLELDDAEEFCVVHGLAVGVSASSEVQLLVKQAEFGMPKQGARHYHSRVIQEKHPGSFQKACAGN